MAKILIINGPNLNMLGTRQPEIYGHRTLSDIETSCVEIATQNAVTVECVQSNHEGEIVSHIQQAAGTYDGIIINAGGYSHTSVAIRDALALYLGIIIEVHISNIYKRELFRHTSMLSAVSDGIIVGLGENSYYLALRAIADKLSSAN